MGQTRNEYEDMPPLLDVVDSDDERDILNLEESSGQGSLSTFTQNLEVVAGVVRDDATKSQVRVHVRVDAFSRFISAGNVRVERLWKKVEKVETGAKNQADVDSDKSR